MQQRNVAIFIFDEIEVLDFAGPFEVFNVTSEMIEGNPFNVFTVAETASPVKTRGKLSINPNYSIYAMPKADILIVPGGRGTRSLVHKPQIIEWLQAQHDQTEHLLSVCTGSLVLAKAGLLDGKSATTHHDAFDELRNLVSADTQIVDNRYVDNGKIVTAGGISAGIDMSLYIVRKLLGDDVLKVTLEEMEYHWTPDDSPIWKEVEI